MAKAEALTIIHEYRDYIETICRTRTIQAQIMNCVRIILLKADSKSIDDIAEKVGINRNSVLLSLRKYKEGGVENTIYEKPGRGRNPEITDDEKTWIIDVACRKSTEFGYTAETWTYAKLILISSRLP